MLALLTTQISCSSSPYNYDFTEITLSRGGCFGTCPVYKLTIEDDGKVTYQGDKFVKIKGKKESTLSNAKLKEIKAAFKKVDYFNLKDSYIKTDATDMPTIITSFKTKSKRKEIVHYHGDFGAPKKLTHLEERIDIIVNTNKWTGM